MVHLKDTTDDIDSVLFVISDGSGGAGALNLTVRDDDRHRPVVRWCGRIRGGHIRMIQNGSSSAKVTSRRAALWWLATLFVGAVLFNYPWELAQAPLYIGMKSFRIPWWHCFVASLGDGLLVLTIFAAGWTVLQQRDWFVRPGVRGYLVMLAIGLAIGVSVEWVAVYLMGRWIYTAQMPLLPGLGVGLFPVLQMLVLPPLIFRVAAMWCGHPSQGRL
jgi:hypothetical protein